MDLILDKDPKENKSNGVKSHDLSSVFPVTVMGLYLRI
jgi:hypothetical protein